MQVTDELIRSVVQEVLTHMRNGRAAPSNGEARSWGVFEDVGQAVAAAVEAQKQFEARGLEDRRKAVQCIRRICTEQAQMLGREELEETRIGRLVHKIEKLTVIAVRSPKRAIVAGPGNPPVVVDETADLEQAARSIIAGAAYDNNLLCIGEKEVFAVAAIFDELMEAMTHYKAQCLERSQIEALTKA